MRAALLAASTAFVVCLLIVVGCGCVWLCVVVCGCGLDMMLMMDFWRCRITVLHLIVGGTSLRTRPQKILPSAHHEDDELPLA